MSTQSLCVLSVLFLAITGCDLLDGEKPETDPATVAAEVCGGEGDPIAETCLADIGQACFAPEGNCVVEQLDGGGQIGWENGHRVEFRRDSANALVVHIEAYATETLCYSGTEVGDASGTKAQTILLDTEGTEFSFISGLSGAIHVTCPDLTPLQFAAEETGSFYQCFYGKTGGGCDFATLAAVLQQAAVSREALGGCVSAAGCPSGMQCCLSNVGPGYCDVFCF